VSTAVETVKNPAGKTTTGKRGVQPLRAGQGHSFLWRRLHSLSGIIPIGAFLMEHFVSNAAATNGPHAYAEQVKFLTSLPFVTVLEFVGIWLPLAYHAGYGIYIWLRATPDLKSYPETSNWLYSLQRWTGIFALLYIIQHVWLLRFSGTHLMYEPGAAFAKVQAELMSPFKLVWYTLGILSACWHFGYGIFLFCSKWGIVTGARARRWLMIVSVLVFLGMSGLGFASLASFLKSDYSKGANGQYIQDSLRDPEKAKAIEAGTDPISQENEKLHQHPEQTQPQQ
jgi:succinate dehydrogenase / fumarate reductase cytochrome b subunit